MLTEPKSLFITVADECHWGPAAFAAHDQMVNDNTSKRGAEEGSASAPQLSELLQQENYVVLLVSATPYNVISRKSRLPEEYMVLKIPSSPVMGHGDAKGIALPHGCKPYDVFQLR